MTRVIPTREWDTRVGIDAFRLMPSMRITGRIVEPEIKQLPVICQLNKGLAR